MLPIHMDDVEATHYDKRDSENVLQFHITPPFTSPSGPVQLREANSQLSTAIIPTTVNVIAKANTSG